MVPPWGRVPRRWYRQDDSVLRPRKSHQKIGRRGIGPIDNRQKASNIGSRAKKSRVTPKRSRPRRNNKVSDLELTKRINAKTSQVRAEDVEGISNPQMWDLRRRRCSGETDWQADHGAAWRRRFGWRRKKRKVTPPNPNYQRRKGEDSTSINSNTGKSAPVSHWWEGGSAVATTTTAEEEKQGKSALMVLEEADEVGLDRLLERHHRQALEQRSVAEGKLLRSESCCILYRTGDGCDFC
ncbi:hypothetical protein MUK42_24429 [Musa troglodytarum]|uniref:Uncharacterized protein n=1 Tax=Musa troglodytarum TaxID=320322 RepID=A0A9E7FVR0_9LILI|nr:hypothetical protein MUK42_24429 [Musa troglodytarum]